MFLYCTFHVNYFISDFTLSFFYSIKKLCRHKDQKPLYTFSTVTKLPNTSRLNQPDSSHHSTSSARQHYLRQSRYLPGKISIWFSHFMCGDWSFVHKLQWCTVHHIMNKMIINAYQTQAQFNSAFHTFLELITLHVQIIRRRRRITCDVANVIAICISFA